MQLSDFRDIKADPATVWAAILNPEVLKECVPGCESMTGSPEEGFEAVVTQKVGPVKATFKGAVSISDRVEGQSLKISGEGKGGHCGYRHQGLATSQVGSHRVNVSSVRTAAATGWMPLDVIDTTC